MYFSTEPKERRSDLFGMNYQLDLLKRYLADKDIRLIVIKGLRRTGKTSLLNVALHETGESIKIDVRESPFFDKKEFMIYLIKKIKEKNGNLIEKIIKNISGMKIGYKEISLELFFRKDENTSMFFSNLNSELKKSRKQLILAFDEAQLLKGINFDYFLASIFDNYKNIKLIITGSEIGLLDNLIGKSNYDAPLFGRGYIEVTVEKLKEEDIKRFLEEGFRQINAEIKRKLRNKDLSLSLHSASSAEELQTNEGAMKIKFEEVREVIENLDGIIGWATYYGWFRYKGSSHSKALEKVKEEGRIIVKKELENFLLNRKARAKYLKALNYIRRGQNTWDLLKRAFGKEGIIVSDSQLNLYLKELIDFGFVEKISEKYFMADPVASIAS